MPTEYEFDVFISYSSHDKAWVRGELLTRIEQAGLKAFIDFRDFTPGAASVAECVRGVLECRKTVLVLTPDYLESGWAEIEGIMMQALNPMNRDLRLIPLLKTPCKMPLRIGALTHIDFTGGADLNLAWRQLLTALGVPPEPEPPQEPKREDWFLAHPYSMPPNFTGRAAERAMLTRWLDADAAHPLLVMRALGGLGKSALAWHWLTHDVAAAAWPRVVWWSFYEGDASFDHFLAETLDYLSGGKVQPDKRSGKDAVNTLVEMLHAPGTLLVLDGFERVLRAFGGLDAAYRGDEARAERNDRDCISPLAEAFLYDVALHPNLRSKVLITTRLRPRVVEAKGGGLLQGCREEELMQMRPSDAVEFFRARGIRGTRAKIEQACAPYGYHPLSLRLLAGLIVGDFQQPGDIAAAEQLDVSADLVARQHHVLDTAYSSLTPAQQALLGRIASFLRPVKYDALRAMAEAAREPAATLDAGLRDLAAHGLLHQDTKTGRFDLHPIVRRYAYDRLAAPDRAAQSEPAKRVFLDFSELNPRTFEMLVSDLLVALGFSIQQTTLDRGSGFDFVALFSSRDPFGAKRQDRWLVEVRLYRDRRVSLSALRRMLNYLMTKAEQGDKGLVVTDSLLTSAARDFLSEFSATSGHELHVIDGTELTSLLSQHPGLVERYLRPSAVQ